MKFEPIAIPNNEAQFLETRKFQVDEICRIFRVPPHLVGNLEHATFSNIEHQSIDFAVHTFRPWLVRIEQAMNRALLSDQEKQEKSELGAAIALNMLCKQRSQDTDDHQRMGGAGDQDANQARQFTERAYLAEIIILDKKRKDVLEQQG